MKEGGQIDFFVQIFINLIATFSTTVEKWHLGEDDDTSQKKLLSFIRESLLEVTLKEQVDLS